MFHHFDFVSSNTTARPMADKASTHYRAKGLEMTYFNYRIGFTWQPEVRSPVICKCIELTGFAMLVALAKKQFWPISGNSSIHFYRLVTANPNGPDLYARRTTNGSDNITDEPQTRRDGDTLMFSFDLCRRFPRSVYSWFSSLWSPTRVDLAADISKEIRKALRM